MEQKEQTAKYLSWLLYIGIASISLNVVKDILVNDSWASWLQLLLNAGIVVCLYLLRPAGNNYRLSALARALTLLLSTVALAINTFLLPELIAAPEKMQLFNLFTRASGILMFLLSTLGLWLEYRAHGMLVSGRDIGFQRKWNNLFFLRLGAALFYSLGTYVAAYFQQLLQWDIATTHGLVLAILNLPVKAAYLLYLLYLYRTIRLVRES
jgi:hypothetical protein